MASLARFGRALRAQFETLRTSGHPKWREVEPATPESGTGWQYHAPIARDRPLRGDGPGAGARDICPGQPRSCTIEQNILGLCR